MTVRDLPPVNELTVQQQRGWRCVWCRYPITTGADIDLGVQRTRAGNGAAFSWFPRCCSDVEGCAGREAKGVPQ